MFSCVQSVRGGVCDPHPFKQNTPANRIQNPTLTIGLRFLPKLPINVFIHYRELLFVVFNLGHQAPLYGMGLLNSSHW